jgi:2-amino-4-hydroxy-6-hydroxymethyldihydropteridine diphosphokinase
MHYVYIGLGSNLSDPGQQILLALNSINELPNTDLVSTSSLYGSKPLGPQDQPDFVNSVCLVKTELSPQGLLEALKKIEKDQGRVKKRLWGERLIDLDILLYDDMEMTTEELTIPHSQMHLRAFVLKPLVEIAPAIKIPKLGSAEQLLAQLADGYLITLNS